MSREITCTTCATRLAVRDEAPERISCPRCLTVIDTPGGGVGWSGQRSVDREIRSDTGTTHVILLVFTVLCAVGILLAYVSGRSHREPILEMLIIAGLFAVLDVLVFVQLGLRVWTRPLGRSRDAVQRFGKVLSVIALTVGLALAVVVFFFVTCYGMLVTM